MIPAWLLRLLPHLGIALAMVGAVWWLDRAGYRRAMADRDARDAAMLTQVRVELRTTERQLASAIDVIASDYETRRKALAQTGLSLQPILIREIADVPRLADPAAGLTPGLLDAVNRAREAGACASAASGGIECALPAPASGQEPEHR